MTTSQIRRLEAIRRRGDVDHPYGFTYPQLKLSMNGAFSLETLLRAMGGKPVQERFYAYIAEWLDRFFPEAPLGDGKALAAGQDADYSEAQSEAQAEELAGRRDEVPDKNELDKEAAPSTRTLRGSR